MPAKEDEGFYNSAQGPWIFRMKACCTFSGCQGGIALQQGSGEQNRMAGLPTEEIPVELPGTDRGGWS